MFNKLLTRLLRHDRLQDPVRDAYVSMFPGSRMYWEDRYAHGKTSGNGSYGRLSEFKADVVNSFINEYNIKSAIEFGCGDGNQLSLFEIADYIGLDASPTAVQRCIREHGGDNKSFMLYDSKSFLDNHGILSAEMGLSLDVIFHLVEDEIYKKYMEQLFDSAEKYVVIYSSNTDSDTKYGIENADHVKHREFTKLIKVNNPQWDLINKVNNRYPYDAESEKPTSFSDFYVYSNE